MLLLAAGLASALPSAQSDAAARIARIEAPQVPDRQGFDGLTLPQVLERLRVPGVSIAVVKDFQVHWAKAYGVADVATSRSAETSTRFQAASISKPVTAMAAMRLAQDRRLDLDADVNTVLTSWKVPASDLTRGRPVTPRSLFSHTSGADDGFGFPGYDPAAAAAHAGADPERPGAVQRGAGALRASAVPGLQSTRAAASRSCSSR